MSNQTLDHLSIIVAVAKNGAIGLNNQLLYRLPNDLKRFKALTSGQTVLMGRKTLQTLPGGKGLPKRRNVVLTTDRDFVAENVETVHTLAGAVFAAGADAFVIGGGSIYRQMLPFCDTAYITKVHVTPESDTFFPDLDKDPAWILAEVLQSGEENGIAYDILLYRRKEN